MTDNELILDDRLTKIRQVISEYGGFVVETKKASIMECRHSMMILVMIGRIEMKPIKAKPIISANVILWGDDRNKSHELIKGRNCEGSVIGFDKRQIWTVFPYKRYSSDTEYCGACEYKSFYIRLMPNDFYRIFGTDIVEIAEKG